MAPECECSEYERGDYAYPQSVEPRIAEALGGMWSPYDGTEFDSLRGSQIEHIVALREAHDSGLCAVNRATRSRFASDLLNLTLATPAENREKGQDDAAWWVPDHNRCWFAAQVVACARSTGSPSTGRKRQRWTASLRGAPRRMRRSLIGVAATSRLVRLGLPVFEFSADPAVLRGHRVEVGLATLNACVTNACRGLRSLACRNDVDRPAAAPRILRRGHTARGSLHQYPIRSRASTKVRVVTDPPCEPPRILNSANFRTGG